MTSFNHILSKLPERKPSSGKIHTIFNAPLEFVQEIDFRLFRCISDIHITTSNVAVFLLFLGECALLNEAFETTISILYTLSILFVEQKSEINMYMWSQSMVVLLWTLSCIYREEWKYNVENRACSQQLKWKLYPARLTFNLTSGN